MVKDARESRVLSQWCIGGLLGLRGLDFWSLPPRTLEAGVWVIFWCFSLAAEPSASERVGKMTLSGTVLELKTGTHETT